MGSVPLGVAFRVWEGKGCEFGVKALCRSRSIIPCGSALSQVCGHYVLSASVALFCFECTLGNASEAWSPLSPKP